MEKTLSEHLIETGKSNICAARELDVSPNSISRYKSRERRPDEKTMEKILLWSGYQVTANSFMYTQEVFDKLREKCLKTK